MKFVDPLLSAGDGIIGVKVAARLIVESGLQSKAGDEEVLARLGLFGLDGDGWAPFDGGGGRGRGGRGRIGGRDADFGPFRPIVKRTFTFKLSNMLSTAIKRPEL